MSTRASTVSCPQPAKVMTPCNDCFWRRMPGASHPSAMRKKEPPSVVRQRCAVFRTAFSCVYNLKPINISKIGRLYRDTNSALKKEPPSVVRQRCAVFRTAFSCVNNLESTNISKIGRFYRDTK